MAIAFLLTALTQYSHLLGKAISSFDTVTSHSYFSTTIRVPTGGLFIGSFSPINYTTSGLSRNYSTLIPATSLNLFQLSLELDTGLVTTNPYILCSRAFASDNV